jgi:tetratricopeptide (TPR) repeat protein
MRANEPIVQIAFRSPSEVVREVGLPVVLLSLAVWGAFGRVLTNGLVFDDLDTIKYNTTITSLTNLSVLFSRKDYFRLSDEYSYRPIVTLSYFLDHAIGGKNPAVYHFHNLAIHHLNVLLVFTLFYLLRAGRWPAFAVALLFALHPLNAEAVIFPGFREDLQMTLGMLAASVCLTADRNRLTGRWFLGAPPTLAFALFAKEGALLLPAAWLAFDAIHNSTQRPRLNLKRRHGLIVLVVIVYVAVRFFVMTNPDAAELDVVDRLPLGQRLLTAPCLFAYYARRFLWPTPLCIIHEIEPLRQADAAFGGSMIIVAAVVGLWIVAALLEKWPWFAGLWIAAAFAPVANLYPIVNLWAERFYYSVGIGMSALVVAAVAAAWDRLARRLSEDRRLALAIAGWLLVGLLGWSAAVCDLKRITECRDSLSLWRATVRCVPTNETALATLAIAELEAGNLSRAETIAREAEQRGGGVYRFNYILGQAAFRRGDWASAIARLEKALTVPPPSIQSRTTLVLSLTRAYLKAGRPDRAATLLRKGLEWDPQNRALGSILGQIETQPAEAPSTAPAAAKQ